MRSYKLLALLTFLVWSGTHAQISPSTSENVDYLITFGKECKKSWGDDDFSQVHFFVIPEKETAPVYIRIYDPDTGGELDTKNNNFNTRCSYRLFGGKGTHSTKAARAIDPVAGYDSGKLIKTKTFGADPEYDKKWFVFGPLNPSEGEYSEEFEGYIFKIICNGISGDDGNAYRYSMSYEKNANIPVENGNIFTYELSFRFKQKAKATAHIYPFMADGIIAFKQFNFDADSDLNIRITSIARKLVPSKVSGNATWATSSYKVLAKEKNTTVDIQMIKKSNSVNDMVIYVLNQYDEAMPLYSVPIGGKPKYHYKLKVNYKF